MTVSPVDRLGGHMAPIALAAADARFPAKLGERLGEGAPAQLATLGNLAILNSPKTAFFCSAKTPGHVILAAYDQAARWRDDGRCVISGFHSPVEKECLRILLRGRQPVAICLARGLDGMRLPAEWRGALADDRLLVLSQFPARQRRVTTLAAVDRNRVAAALADDVVFAHISPDGHLNELRRLVAGWDVQHHAIAV